ncbi:class I SAM-dependent rRNA methyltransferase [Bacillus sp. DTU_2020_1000418_1_SI_GHA_SEK_038]|uniref:class I SAM-dependent rRNA methyltransferase n=1 Tax=Bacillus sp. DTU_2020_1000418_1_SI_GHA_SEK_038 TaxID=3077585 RepID=UPI0028ED8588|nr:class I SAM-dependent rRNA methyltransferase [Bacillus sp. DTU_2020_1000418_1_SI_GHA_SEK_038]WNS76296.1 class I SAM-dependent rRNA methyltransferase [Bacillus sp. DTU_2020_1000418_1_SI_GHA_SEK_038]
MKNEISLKVKSVYVRNFQTGYPLITEDAFVKMPVDIEEGTIINLLDEKNRYLATGYFGKQNKGRGWILSRNQQELIDQDFFETKLKKALDNRKVFFDDKDTTAFRVFNGEGDGIGGMTIDYFAGYYLATWYSEGIYQFKNDILQALFKVADVKGVYEKKRFDVKGTYIEDDDFVAGERAVFPLIVKENGINFAVYLNDGAMVGVFLDQRNVRKAIRDKYAKGKTVLNTFSYTGAFSVAAALGGAAKTTSVDLANRSKSKTIEQFSVNNIDYEAHEIIVEDVFNYFKYAVRKQLKFQMVILDPPSFARSKKHTFSAGKDYPALLEQAIQLTDSNGIIVASTNCSTFDMKKFKGFIEKAFKQTGSKYTILDEFSLPEDFKTIKEFKEGNYLKVAIIRKLT